MLSLLQGVGVPGGCGGLPQQGWGDWRSGAGWAALLTLPRGLAPHAPRPRLLHSLMNLKRIIINAAHYLVLGDKDAYHYDPAAPFLGTVSQTLPLARTSGLSPAACVLLAVASRWG